MSDDHAWYPDSSGTARGGPHDGGARGNGGGAYGSGGGRGGGGGARNGTGGDGWGSEDQGREWGDGRGWGEDGGSQPERYGPPSAPTPAPRRRSDRVDRPERIDRGAPTGVPGGPGAPNVPGSPGAPGGPGSRRAAPPTGRRGAAPVGAGGPATSDAAARTMVSAAEPAGRINADLDLDEVDPHGRAQRKAAAASRSRNRTRAGRAVRWTALGMSTVLLAAVGVGGYVYVHFNANIKSAPLLPGGVTQAPEIPNKFGQTAMNILLLGNAGRINAADCQLGGACDDTATSADSMMVLHLSADRSNMTVMSIPRDSIVSLPSCAGSSRNLINASLVGGPSCSVEAVNQLTGLTIDHFIEIDMSGVVTMSNAVGGVPVCVTNNMYDSYSHIKLPKGESTIQGTQALAWLRTRHAFSNEVDREEAQHMFLAALVRKLKDNASFTHITTLYSVADAATKALTVDPDLSSVTDLLSLAQELGKTPTDRISFMSVPTVPYTGTNAAWREQLQFDQPSATTMFAALKTDQPYTAGSSSDAGSTAKTQTSTTQASPSPSTSTSAPSVLVSQVHAEIENGSGISGRASTVRNTLVSAGFTSGDLTVGNASQNTSTTAVYYPADRAQSAQAVANALGIPASAVHESSSHSTVTVVIGSDWASGSMYAGSAGASSGSTGTGSAAPTTVASSPPSSSLETNGADTKACMYVAQPEW